MPPQLTKHGVRDLNGPKLNGRAHNGRASASCPHFRALDFSTYRIEELREVDGELKLVGITKCTNCDEVRWTDLDDGADK